MSADYIYLTSKEINDLEDKLQDRKAFLTDEVLANCVLPSFFLLSDQSEVNFSITEYCLMDDRLRVRLGTDIMFEVEFLPASPLEVNQTVKSRVRVMPDCPQSYIDWLTQRVSPNGMQNWMNAAIPFFIINGYLLRYEQKDVFEKTSKTIMQSVPSKKHGTSRVARTYKCYTLKKNWKRAKKRKAEITCPAWGVRGHYRHYANGNVVFVKAYVKGKDKDKYQGKEYRILPKKGIKNGQGNESEAS